MIAIALGAFFAAASVAAPSEAPRLQCDIGPASEFIGGNPWTVYACADGLSVVILAVDPNPAAPFVFVVTPDGNGVTLSGEGTGPAAATDPAYAQLKAMSAEGLAKLHRKASTAK